MTHLVNVPRLTDAAAFLRQSFGEGLACRGWVSGVLPNRHLVRLGPNELAGNPRSDQAAADATQTEKEPWS
jgi:hypothetical protein